MHPSGSDKTERGSKLTQVNEPYPLPSIFPPEGSTTIHGMGATVAAHPVTDIRLFHDGELSGCVP